MLNATLKMHLYKDPVLDMLLKKNIHTMYMLLTRQSHSNNIYIISANTFILRLCSACIKKKKKSEKGNEL